MNRESLLHFFIFCNIQIFQKFVQGENDYKNIMTSEEFLNCDYIDVGGKLEALRLGNEYLKQDFLVMKYQLDNQQGRWLDLDKKLDKIALNLQTIENKILKESKDHFIKVKDLTLQQYQTILSKFPAPGGDGKWELLIDIKEILKTHNNIFQTFEGKFKNLENILNKSTEENQTRQSTNFRLLQNIDKKLTGIENVIATQESQMAVNQNKTQELGNSISNNFRNIDKKLTDIGSKTATHETQMSNYQNQARELGNSISQNFGALKNIDKKFNDIEKLIATQETQMAVNQNKSRELGNSISNNFRNIEKKLTDIGSKTATHETQMSNYQNQARELGNSISQNFGALKNIDKKLTDIENVIATQETQLAVNQNKSRELGNSISNNIRNIDKKLTDIGSKTATHETQMSNYQNQARELGNSISQNFGALKNIDKKLNDIEKLIATQETQMAVNQNKSRELGNSISNNIRNIDKKLTDIGSKTATHETQMSNYQNQARELGNSISQNFGALKNIDKKLTGIENVISTQETQMAVNQNKSRELGNSISNNIRNIDKKLTDIGSKTATHESQMSNYQNQARELNNSISQNFGALKNIDKKLTGIENVIATQETQMAINQNLQKYLEKTESMKTCFESEKQKLICTAGTYPTDCADYKEKLCSNNTCRIYNYLFGADPFLVSCDNKTEGGGWTVIQRRMDGSVDFYRDWSEYKTGFGDINGEFFIGLDKLNALTTTLKPVELLIRIEKFEGRIEYAKYDEFEVGNELEKFKLKKLGQLKGNTTDCLSKHRGYNFSTKDRKNDINHISCAPFYHGAWWYFNCMTSNLNGKYYKTSDTGGKLDGITWCSRDGYNYSLKSTQMSIRPIRL